MNYLLFIITLTFCCLSSVSCRRAQRGDRQIRQSSSEPAKLSEMREVNLTTVYFPTDHGRWTDRIVSSFEMTLVNARIPINFQRVAWVYGKNDHEIVENVFKSRPDIVFLPNDRMYELFAEEIYLKTRAKIIFVAYYSPPSKLKKLPDTDQAGSLHYYPLSTSLSTIQRVFNIRTIGVVKGPSSTTASAIVALRENIPHLIAEEFSTESYKEYAKKLGEFAGKYDAVWVMSPFGVFDERTGQWVSEYELQILLDTLPKPTIGWGTMSNLCRTVELSIDPELLGKSAGDAAIEGILHNRYSVKEIKTFEIKMSGRHLRKFNRQIPIELLGNSITIR